MRKILGLAAKARSGKDTAAAILLGHPEVAAYALADPLKAGCKALFGLSDAQAWDDNLKETMMSAWGRSPRQLFQQVGTEWMRQLDPLHWLKRADREINSAPIIADGVGPDDAGTPFLRAAQAIYGISDLQMFDARHVPDAQWGLTPEELLQQIKTLVWRDFPNYPEQYRSHTATLHAQSSEAVATTSVSTLRPMPIGETSNAMYKYKTNFDGKSLIIIKDIRFENEAEYIRNLGGEVWHIIRPNAGVINDHSSETGIAIREGEVVIYNEGTLDQYTSAVDAAWQAISKTI
jgi:hypothetical protein